MASELNVGKTKLDAANTDPLGSYTGNSQLVIGASGNTPKLAISRDTDGDNAYIHSYEDGVGAKNLVLQPGGGNVGVGVSPAATSQLHVQADTAQVRIEGTNDSAAASVAELIIEASADRRCGVRFEDRDDGTQSGFIGRGYDSPDSLTFETGTTERLTIGSTGLATFSNGIDVQNGFLTIGNNSELTISSGAVTIVDSFHTIDTQANAASDDLDTINGGAEGTLLYISANVATRTVVAKDGTGNLRLAGDFTIDHSTDVLTLLKAGSNWHEVCRSDNAS